MTNALRVAAVLKAAETELRLSSETPKLDAEVLLAHSLRQARSYLYAHPERVVDLEAHLIFKDLLAKRRQKEPLAYLTGIQEFWSLPLQVNQHTLIPRPETELLVEFVLTHFTQSHLTVADLGTGSGAIAIALASEKPNWQIMATDISADALTVAKLNAQTLKLNNINFLQGDWCQALSPNLQCDVICSNPPYLSDEDWGIYGPNLAFEPPIALRAGYNGLTDIEQIVSSVKSHLKPNGYLIIEHGFSQEQAVRDILTAHHFYAIECKYDLSGNARLTVGRAGTSHDN